MTFDILLLQADVLSCPWWWLFSFLAFLLGALLYWLLFGRPKDAEIVRLTGERDDYHGRFTTMEADYAGLRYQHEELQKDHNALRTSLQRCEADKAVLRTKLDKALEAGAGGETSGGGIAAAGLGLVGATSGAGEKSVAATDYASIFGADNLQIVEGIGPKTEQLLKDSGIGTWAALAATSVDRLREILDGGGATFRLIKPDTWPRQAQLADEGKWDELIEYQQFLGGGNEGRGDMENDSKLQKLAMRALGFSNRPDDLKIIEGIGPKIEQLLKDAGINDWSDLAAAPVDRLQDILNAAGERYRLAKPDTWPRQAQLANEGKWNELRDYQDFLSGGKE